MGFEVSASSYSTPSRTVHTDEFDWLPLHKRVLEYLKQFHNERPETTELTLTIYGDKDCEYRPLYSYLKNFRNLETLILKSNFWDNKMKPVLFDELKHIPKLKRLSLGWEFEIDKSISQLASKLIYLEVDYQPFLLSYLHTFTILETFIIKKWSRMFWISKLPDSVKTLKFEKCSFVRSEVAYIKNSFAITNPNLRLYFEDCRID